jgi:hypothetical protein
MGRRCVIRRAEAPDREEMIMTEDDRGRQEYVHRLLDAYRTTPGTSGYVRSADRRFAGTLYEQQIPLPAVEHALILATARRLLRPADAPPLGPVRSLHYFRAVIDEVMGSPVGEDYYHYLRGKIERYMKSRTTQ